MSNDIAARQIENLLGIIETVQREKGDLRDQIARYAIERQELGRKLAEAREVLKTVVGDKDRTIELLSKERDELLRERGRRQ